MSDVRPPAAPPPSGPARKGPGEVRLKVAYKTPGALLNEFTRSVGKGGVAIEARKSLPVGTRFIFELHTQGQREPAEVLGEVVRVVPQSKGRYLLNIRYDAGPHREGLEQLIQRVFEAQRDEKNRKHPRLPLQLLATEETPYSPSYVIRDLSRGGVGVEVEAPELPKAAVVGAPFLLEILLSLGTLSLHGEVLWAFTPPPDRAKWINPSFGVSFGQLRPETAARLDGILQLKGLPSPPWRARLSFGSNAVKRMP